MINRGLWSVLLLIIGCGISQAQEKSALTLHEAVIGAQGELKPTTLKQFSWLPEASGYAFKEGEGDAERLVVKTAGKRDHREITLTALISALKAINYSEMRNFPPVMWTSNTAFVFQHNHHLFQYIIESGDA